MGVRGEYYEAIADEGGLGCLGFVIAEVLTKLKWGMEYKGTLKCAFLLSVPGGSLK